MKRVVTDALDRLRTSFGICLLAYVVMPEHLHALLFPHRRGAVQPVPISDLLQDFKEHVGFHGKERLREVWRKEGRLRAEPLNAWAKGGYGDCVIMEPRGYDRNIFSELELREKVDYIHKNPITRGLVATTDAWPWSSYRYFMLHDESILRMDWDGAWPIDW